MGDGTRSRSLIDVFSDDGQTWSECSRAKRGGQLDERAPTREHRIAK